MSEIKNIIFDFGGVLVDWNQVYLYKNVFDTAEEMNFFLENICNAEWNLQQDAGRFLSIATAEKQAEFPEYKTEIAMYYDRWTEMLGGTLDENVKLVKPLKEKYNVYGLTNWSAETIPLAMERYDFFNDLDGIVVSGGEKIVKPDFRLYQILIERFNITPEQSLFIDDNAKNIEAAQALGFQTIHFTNDVNLEEKLKQMKAL